MAEPSRDRTNLDANTNADATGSFAPNRLAEILEQYLADVQAGQAPSRDELLARHPDLAAELEPCLAGLDFIQQATTAEQPARLGDFRVVREVGRGGMGVVYEAEQISLRRHVALKVLRFGAASDDDSLKRFQREAETVARLHHTNIVPIFAVGCEQGVHYFAMQFIEGVSLADRMREGSCPPREVARWGMQAAEALAYAHERGVVHRDIKPSNLLIDGQGVVWLTDFGLAKHADEVTLTTSGALLGTPRYMSPEQAQAATIPVDHRTDVYSLGASLYELATGKPAFDATTPQAVLAQILFDEPAPPRSVRPELPRDLETIILKCLAKDPPRRYGSARELADDLRAFLDNRSIKARRPTLVERGVRWAQKQRRTSHVAATAVAVSLLLALAIGLFGMWYLRARLAHFQLATTGPHLKAEVLAGDTVAATFTVPTQEPQPLPPGDYRLRVSSPDRLPAEYRFDASWGQSLGFSVSPEPRPLWEVSKTDGSSYPIIPLDDRGDMIVFAAVSAELPAGGVQRIDGRTAKPIWTFDPQSKDHKIPDMSRFGLLRRNDDAFPNPPMPPGVVRPMRDLDGDGVPDVVIASRHLPALLALSGKTGQMLWLSQAQADLPNGLTADRVAMRQPNEPSWVLGLPAMADIGGEPVLFAIVWINGERVWEKDTLRTPFAAAQGRIEALTAKTGRRLWSTSLPADVESSRNTVPHAIDVGDAVRIVVGGRYLEFDRDSGKLLATRDCLPGVTRLASTPRFVPLKGGKLGVLVDTEIDRTPRELVMLAASDGEVLWRTNAALGEIADLDGDGVSEVLVSGRLAEGAAEKPQPRLWFLPPPPRWGNGSARMSVKVLDAATGERRWQRDLAALPSAGSGLVVGPDLDGDGRRDVFAATTSALPDGRDWRLAVFVDAFSGADGRSLWRTSIPRPGPWSPHRASEDAFDPLRWGPFGADGRRQLLVSYWPRRRPFAKDPQNYLIEATSGKLLGAIGDLGVRDADDLDGDGLPDLLVHTTPNANQRPPQGRLMAQRSPPPLVWSRLGNLQDSPGDTDTWMLAQDLDGDGVRDLVGRAPAGSAALFGRDGARLWNSKSSLLGWVAPPVADLDGDGSSELFGVPYREAALRRLQCLSGKTGRPLWTSPITEDNEYITLVNNQTPFADCIVADEKDAKAADVFAIYRINGRNDHSEKSARYWLFRISGRDGRLLWRQPINAAAASNYLHRFAPAFADFDGDGVLDAALVSPEPKSVLRNKIPQADAGGEVRLVNDPNDGAGADLVVFSGNDGHELWRVPLFVESAFHTPNVGNYSDLPRPLVVDVDRDGVPDVVVSRPVIAAEQPPGMRHPVEVVALSGKGGAVLWKWRGDDGQRIDWNQQWTRSQPRVVRGPGDRFWLGVAIHDAALRDGDPSKSGRQLVLLDLDGAVAHRMDLTGERHHEVRARFWPVDVDGDGADEVIVEANGETLRAVRFHRDKAAWTAADLWRSSLIENQDIDIRTTTAGPPAVVLATQRDAVALNARTGTPLWKCDVPGPVILGVDVATPPLVAGNEPGLNLQGENRQVLTAIICRRAVPVKSTGRYDPDAMERAAVPPLSEPDPRLVRPLPWQGEPGGGMTVVAIVALVAALVFAALRSPMRWAWRWMLRPRFAIGAAALLLVAYGVFAAVTPYGFAPVAALLIVSLGLPVVWLAAHMWHALRTGAWRTLAVLVGLMVLSTVGLASLCFANDDPLAEGERYVWTNAWWILPPGIYLAAFLFLLATPVEKWLRRRRAT